MAEALINARHEGWQAASAGTQPAEHVNPYALRALEEIGIVPSDATPKHIEQFRDEAFDLVITVCEDANETCPLWLGQGKRVHIGFPDPAKATGTDAEILAAFRTIRDAIDEQVVARLDSHTTRGV